MFKILLGWLFLALTVYGFKSINETRRLQLRDEAKEMFYHAFDSYMTYAYPFDELKPLNCVGHGHDRINLNNIGVNDVMGDFSLTLVDSLDALAILGDKEGFENAIKLVIRDVKFNVDSKVQVFEVTIRMLGGLLSGHLIATDPDLGFKLNWYNNELLDLAYDLGKRLLPAFYSSPTPFPFARVNLKKGMDRFESSDTCTAGVGTLLLEFGTLSRLTGDKRFEEVARKAMDGLWEMQFETGLVGTTLDMRLGKWTYKMAGIGAGVDSYFEYLLKVAILFDDPIYLNRFELSYTALLTKARDRTGFFYLNVHANTTQLLNTWVDALSAYFPGMQVLAGDLDNAIKSHLVYYNLWRRYGAMPERYDLELGVPTLYYYPLRPEFIESTYMLYQATKDPFYLSVGEMILMDLQNLTRQKCGFASLKNISQNTHDDRMESFFLSETLKYLYLLFDQDNFINKLDGNFVFNTEGHLFKLPHNISGNINQYQQDLQHWKLKCDKFNPLPFYDSGITSRDDFDFIQALMGSPPIKLPSIHSNAKCIIPSPNAQTQGLNRKNLDQIALNNLNQLFKDNPKKGINLDMLIIIEIYQSHLKIDSLIGITSYPSTLPDIINNDIKYQLIKPTHPTNGCSPYPNNFNNQAILIQRGDCNFKIKAKHANQNDAGLIIFINNENELFMPKLMDLEGLDDLIVILVTKDIGEKLMKFNDIEILIKKI